jgi:hypothetical protein
MNHKTYDPVTEKEYNVENEYDYQIQRFCELNQYVKHEEEVIDFAFSLRDELINDLENKDDTIRLKNIKWVDDEYLFRTKDFLIAQKLPIPERLIGFKSFKYEHQIQEINNNPPEQNTTKPAKNKGGRPKDPKIAKLRKQLDIDYYSLTEKDGYKRSKALDLLEEKYPWRRSTIQTYLKK